MATVIIITHPTDSYMYFVEKNIADIPDIFQEHVAQALADAQCAWRPFFGK